VSARAEVAHATRGRARIRLPSAKGDARFFTRVEEELRGVPGVADVRVNPTTASVLVRHAGDLGAIAQHARARDLFELSDLPTGAAPEGRAAESSSARGHAAGWTLDEVRRRLLRLDEIVRERSNESVDVRMMVFAALLGGSVYQLTRGKFLPAGAAMLMEATKMLFYGTRPDERPRGGEPGRP